MKNFTHFVGAFSGSHSVASYKTKLFSQNQVIFAAIFDLKAPYQTVLKSLFAAFGRKLHATFLSALGLMMLLMSGLSFGQTNPTPFDLSTGNWTLTGWNTAVPAGSYPGNGATGTNATTGVVATAGNGNMMFWKHGGNIDPPITTAESADITAVYTAGNARIVGNGTSGFYFDNTAAGGIGSAVLAINTTNRTGIQVAWTGRTIAIGARQYGIRLQYRVGTSGAWIDANGTVANILYSGATAGTSQVMPVVTLPVGAENQPVVQLLWRFYYIGPSTGARPQFGLDEITVSSSTASIAPFLAITGNVAHGSVCPSSNATLISYTITNNGSTAAGGVTVASNDPQFVVSVLSSTSIPANGGTATYSVTFTPGSSGAKSATVTVASTTSGSNSPTNSLTGTGLTPVTQAVASSAATSVTAKSATLNGNITTLGVCPVTTEKGFVYSLTATNADPLVLGTGVTKTPVAGIAPGAYPLALSALSASTGYSYKAYVYDGTTYTYSGVQTFSTATALTVTGTLAHGSTCPNVAATSKTYTITNNSNQTVTSLSVSSDNTEFVVSGLSSTTVAVAATATYTVTFTPSSSGNKSAIITISGINAANVTSNLTGTGSTPVTQAVASSAASAVTAQSATLNGNVTTLGVCPATIEKGFVYSLTAANADPLVSGIGVTKTAVAGISPGTYPLALSALSASTGYSYKAYVYDGITYNYSGVQTFTTLTPPINDDCANPTALLINAATTNGTLKEATLTAPFTAGINDVWYKFTVTQTADYTITVGGFSDDVDFDLISTQCPSTSTYIDRAFTSNNPEILTINLTPATYYIRVNSFNVAASNSNFHIAVTVPKLLSANGSTALDFGTVIKNNVSATQSFNASAVFLAPGQVVTVTAPANYEVALTDTSLSFGPSVTLNADSNGVVASTPIYVRLNTAAACGLVSGNVVISATGATSVNVAVSGTAAVTAPVATGVTNVTGTSFTAHWNEVPGATSYVLAVYTITGSTVVEKLTENFDKFTRGTTGGGAFGTNIATSLNAYTQTTGWSGVSVYEAGGTAKMGTGSIKGSLTTPSINLSANGGAFTLDFESMAWNGDANNLNIYLDGTLVNSITDLSNSSSYALAPYHLELTGGTVSSVIKFEAKVASNNRFFLENVVVKQGGGSSVLYVLQNENVGNVTSYNVTGLDANTSYYYTVRAVNGSCTSPNSNVITDKTVWNGTAWSNVTGPTANVEATIKGAFVTGLTGQNDLIAKKLTVATGGSVQITAGHYIKVDNELVNNLTAAAFVVESDGNFWQTNPATNTGEITVKRIITIKNNSQYNYVISPTVGTNLKTDIYGTGNSAPFTLYHIESNNKFGNSTGVYIKGRGLAVKEPATGSGTVNAVFKGVPMNEAFSFGLANSNVGTGTTLGYNLTGNPYPSNIDLVKLYKLNTNEDKITSTFYFWDNTVNARTAQEGTGYNGEAYAIFNAASGTYGTGKGAGYLSGTPQAAKVPTYVGKVGQGFMVQSKEQVYKTLDFDNTIRNADSGVGFFGNATKGISSALDDRFWLNLSAPTTITNQVAIVYFDAGLNVFAQDDSELNGSPSDVLYTVIGDKKAVINGRAPFVNTDIIPLGSNGFVAGNYTFSLGNTEGIFVTDQNIYLKDTQTGIITNLSQGTYTFAANAGENTGRFEIIYKPETVLVTDSSMKESLWIYREGLDFVLKAQSKKIDQVEVYDANGRLIYILQPHAITTSLRPEYLTRGVYILKITQGETVTMKKIIK